MLTTNDEQISDGPRHRMDKVDTARGDMLSGKLMRLVADGLKAHGFGVRLPALEDERCIFIERWGGHCELMVDDFALVELECGPWAGAEANPKLTADIVTFLLTGKDDDYPCQGGGDDAHGMRFKGIAGNELRSRGFNVELEVYEDDSCFDVIAEILVTNPATLPNASVLISDDGHFTWECEYLHEVISIEDLVLANLDELAESIVTTVARAISLASGVRG